MIKSFLLPRRAILASAAAALVAWAMPSPRAAQADRAQPKKTAKQPANIPRIPTNTTLVGIL